MNRSLEDFNKIIHKGKNVNFENGFLVFNGHHNIFIGNNVFLVDALINAGDSKGKVVIEDYVFFGHGVKVLARGHNYKKFNEERQREITEKDILIKEGAWIGSGAIVLGGVTIGKHAVIGAGSIVTKDIPDFAIAVGNPAKVKKFIIKQSFFDKIKRFFKLKNK